MQRTGFLPLTRLLKIFARPAFGLTVLFLAVLTAMVFGQPQTSLADSPPSPGDENSLDFFDSNSFDRQLSGKLRDGPAEVTIRFPARITVNSIPKRLDKWFAAVEEYGGRVQLKAEETKSTRGIIGAIIDLIVGVYELARKKIIYGPAEDYNVSVYYLRGEGDITRVVFTRKNI